MLRESALPSATLAGLALALAFVACSSDDKPGGLASSGGSPAAGANSQAGARAIAGTGGMASSSGGASGANSTDEAGAGGDEAAPPAPKAAYPSELEVDVACNATSSSAELLIRNTGDEPLVITSATADSGYLVQTALPLTIAPMSGGTLQITAPAPSASADAGAVSSGKLSFTTNEPGTPTHAVVLTTTVFDGSFEFTDENGAAIDTLQLLYDSGGDCPGPTKYRLKNTGNASFTLSGPTFSAHFGGSDLGDGGQAVPPGGYVELLAAADSSPGNACSATGTLSFSVLGTLCGSAPKLNLEWRKSTDPTASTSCACTLPAF